ncbi:hypothetical protein C8R44DRAFT_731457 [Mycena epipterygia]|nr:hypothetical protein C8R44DRAFT_731457 [Mycena epipterygia]
MNKLISINVETTRPIVDKVFSFDDAKAAFAYLESQIVVPGMASLILFKRGLSAKWGTACPLLILILRLTLARRLQMQDAWAGFSFCLLVDAFVSEPPVIRKRKPPALTIVASHPIVLNAFDRPSRGECDRRSSSFGVMRRIPTGGKVLWRVYLIRRKISHASQHFVCVRDNRHGKIGLQCDGTVRLANNQKGSSKMQSDGTVRLRESEVVKPGSSK